MPIDAHPALLRSLRRGLRPARCWLACSAMLLAFSTLGGCSASPPPLANFPEPTLDVSLTASRDLEAAVFAGGCFWGIEAVFEHVKGVQRVVSGYSGGSADTANYQMVSGGSTQ